MRVTRMQQRTGEYVNNAELDEVLDGDELMISWQIMGSELSPIHMINDQQQHAKVTGRGVEGAVVTGQWQLSRQRNRHGFNQAGP